MTETTERKGSLINWRAECGHWMVCYSLEPTPEQCPDCSDKGRDELESCLKEWRRNLSSAADLSAECAVDDVAQWFAEEGIAAGDDLLRKVQAVADQAREASANLESAERQVRRLIDSLPARTERLTISEAS